MMPDKVSEIPLLERALTPAERRALFKRATPNKGLHAAKPGTGPEGESCGTCKYLFRNRMAKTYLKCNLTRAKWTGGGGSDVRAKDPACSKWEEKP